MAIIPQQFSFPEDWVVDRVQRLEADVQILNSHIGQLLCVSLLDTCHHSLKRQQRPKQRDLKRSTWRLFSASQRARIVPSPCPSSSEQKAGRCREPRCSWAKDEPRPLQSLISPLASPLGAWRKQRRARGRKIDQRFSRKHQQGATGKQKKPHLRTMSLAISEIWLHSSSGKSKLPVIIFFLMSFGMVRLWCLE